MNYKVMKRPMFKMGGKANSQGTGITSGLDEKVNMAIGGGVIKGQNMGAREGFADSNFLGTGMSQADFGALTPQGLMDLQASMLSKDTGRTNDMRDIIKLQALSSLASNVLPNIDNIPAAFVVVFIAAIPELTHSAIPEEIIFRGFLWGYLQKFGWRNWWIWLFQAFMFWIAHLNLLDRAYSFVVVTPIMALIFGVLVWRTKKIDASINCHAIFNSMGNIVNRLILTIMP